MRSGALQAKLRIGQPGDVYEQEADRVADVVMWMPESQKGYNETPSIQRAIQAKTIRNKNRIWGIVESSSVIMTKRLPTYREELEGEVIEKLSSKSVRELNLMITDPKNRQKAINKIVKESGLHLSFLIGGTMLYEPDLIKKCKARKTPKLEKKECENLRGITVKDYRAPLGRDIRVEIGPKAFTSVSVLYSVLYHEYVHTKQRGSFSGGPPKKESEVEAYFFELKQSDITGIASNIEEIIGTFRNLRKFYLTLNKDNKIKYKKDYDWSRNKTLRLLLKHIGATKDPKELGILLPHAIDFRNEVGRELLPKHKAELTAVLQEQTKKLFISQYDRIIKLKKPPEFPTDWYLLKTYYEELSDIEKKNLRSNYFKSLESLFNRLIDSIPRKPTRVSGITVFREMNLSNKKRTLEKLYGDLPPELQSKFKRKYEKGLANLKKALDVIE